MTKDFLHELSVYQGPLWKIVVLGGGISVARILTCPGASKVVSSLYAPYSVEEINNLYGSTSFPNCSIDRTLEIYSQIKGTALVVNAALTSNRYRKGLNRALIQCPWGVLQVDIPKLNQEEHEKLTPLELYDRRVVEDTLLRFILFKILIGEKFDEDFKSQVLNEAEEIGLPDTNLYIVQFCPERQVELFPDSK